MSLTKQERQRAYELVCASDYKLAAKLRELFGDTDRLDYLERRTALSNSGLSINPNMFQRTPAKEFNLMWRFERTEPKPTLRAALDDAAKNYPLPDTVPFDEVEEIMPSEMAPELKATILEMVAGSFGYRAEHINVRTPFSEMEADEIAMFDLTLCVEDHFSIEIPDEDMTWQTTNELINYVQQRIAQREQ
jgi:acyl carrier protein